MFNAGMERLKGLAGGEKMQGPKPLHEMGGFDFTTRVSDN
jgi:hypothetical protein